MRRGSHTLILRTVDTDVVVLAIAVYARLSSEALALWIQMGTGKHVRYIAVHELMDVLGPEKATSYTYMATSLQYYYLFHAFTGCDTLLFLGEGRKHAGTRGLVFQK